jgi:hypothetical protein
MAAPACYHAFKHAFERAARPDFISLARFR